MKAPRYSLRQLFFLMTVVCVLATAFVLVWQLPGNHHEILLILFGFSAVILFSAIVGGMYTHPVGILVINLTLAVILFAESFKKYREIKEEFASFSSWDGCVMALLLASGAVLSWHGIKQIRCMIGQFSGKIDDAPK